MSNVEKPDIFVMCPSCLTHVGGKLGSKSLKCPLCGNLFVVDDLDKNIEFGRRAKALIRTVARQEKQIARLSARLDIFLNSETGAPLRIGKQWELAEVKLVKEMWCQERATLEAIGAAIGRTAKGIATKLEDVLSLSLEEIYTANVKRKKLAEDDNIEEWVGDGDQLDLPSSGGGGFDLDDEVPF